MVLLLAGAAIPSFLAASFLTTSPVAATASSGHLDAVADSIARAYDDESAPALGDSPTLDDYLRVASLRSPALRSAFYRWKSAVENAGYAGALPDPTFNYSYFVESVETRVGPQNQRFALRQMIPWFGTLGARKHRSLEKSNAAWEAFQSERLKLHYRVKTAYYDYYYLGREIAITRENFQLVGFWESVARTKYRVALAGHPDVIKAQVELGKLEDRLRTLEEQKKPTAARLRTALDLADDRDLPVPGAMSVAEVTVDRDSVLAETYANNPDLKALVHAIESERAGTRLAGKASWPRLTLGINYVDTGPATMPGVPDSGKDPLMLSVGVSLPIWFGANGARKREAEARLRLSQSNYDDARNRVAEYVERVVFEYSDALRKTRLYRDGLVPKAEQSLNANYTAYQAGETDFLNVLDAQRQLLEFQLLLERSRSNLAIRRAELEMLTGRGISVTKE